LPKNAKYIIRAKTNNYSTICQKSRMKAIEYPVKAHSVHGMKDRDHLPIE